jgi:hypothetical protein
MSPINSIPFLVLILSINCIFCISLSYDLTDARQELPVRGALTPVCNFFDLSYGETLFSYITPQSSNAENFIDAGKTNNDVILNNVVCDPAKTTCFVEDESIVKTTLKDSPIANDYEIKYETIKDFLGKPYLLNSFQWAPTSLENTNLYLLDIASTLSSVAVWADKIRGFELIRGTFNLRVQINASPFQAGKMILHYLPNYSDRVSVDPQFAARYNSFLIQKFQHPHILLDCRDTVAIFSVPYISPSPYYDVKSATYDWGRIFLDVVSPIAVGASASAGTTTAEVTVFGYWSNVELAAPIRPQSNNKEKFTARKGKDLESKEHTMGPIASGLKAVSSAASTLSSIPFLSPVMTTLSWATDVGSQIASIFGWSKPRINDNIMVMARQPMRYSGTSDGPDASLPVALSCQNAIEMTDDYTITSQDEMSLKFLLSVPTYTERVTWTTAQTSGTALLLNKQLRPQLLSNSVNTTVGLFTHTARYGAPLYYLSNFFDLWRGSIEVNIKVVKTMFHSGKLLITFTPYHNATVSPGVTDSIYSLREIIDIREQSEITLKLPYMLHRHYLDKFQAMGRLDVYVLNDLRCPDTVAQNVDLLFFFKAGDDFEFQSPGVVTVGGGIYTPQSNNVETIVNSGIAETAVKPCTTQYSSKSIGEHFLSIKQLLNRNSQLQAMTNAIVYAGQSIILNPWHIAGITNVPVTGALRTAAYSADAFSYLAPLFNYYRGKSRVLLVADTVNGIMGSNQPNFFQNLGSSQFHNIGGSTYGINLPVIATSDTDRNVFNTPVASGSNHGYQWIHIPYYSKYPVSFTQIWNGGTTNYYLDETQPISTACFTASANFGGSAVLERSFCDDFQLTFFIGCPGIYVGSS